jgi:PII-like signaling protein
MSDRRPGRRVRIYIGENDTWQGRRLYTAIVEEARRHGLAGATVALGIMGFGAHSVVHRVRPLSHDRPVVIEIVDTDEKIHSFFPVLDEMISEGMITTSDVEVIVYRADDRESGKI